MAERSGARSASALWCGAALLAAMLAGAAIAQHWPERWSGAPDHLDRIILLHTLLPRVAMALVCGAVLGLAGILMQRVLRNPLAEPSTLGVASGAQFALAAATAHAPALLEGSREAVALSGGLVAAAAILAVNWRRGLEPVSVALTGMMLSLLFTAGSAALVLANGEYMMSLFIWGGGSLAQDSWGPTLGLSARLCLGALAAGLLLRPISLLALGDSGARSLGLMLGGMRLGLLALAVWLASAATAEVGIIGFVGLAAPALATASGARTAGQKLVASPLIGALLLSLADGLVLLGSDAGAERVPTGAATALLGGPLLLWLLPRLRMAERPDFAAAPRPSRRLARPAAALVGLAAALAATAALALALGRGPDGLSLATGALFMDLLPWRGPRVAVALAAGAMLAAAGLMLQRVTANPLASPEILGVGAGAGLGLAVALALVPDAGLDLRLGASALAALSVLAVLLAVAAKGRLGPERLLLAGVAIGAFCSAVLTAVIATGSRLAFSLLDWLSGSVNDATPFQAAFMLAAAFGLLMPLALVRRWLDALPLGRASAQALGVPVRPAEAALVLWAGVLTACASLFVGPLSFVGLLAPHLARTAGFARAGTALAASALIGATLLVLSDWLSRMAAFPYQLPLGLFATLLGGPYLVWSLAGGIRRRNG